MPPGHEKCYTVDGRRRATARRDSAKAPRQPEHHNEARRNRGHVARPAVRKRDKSALESTRLGAPKQVEYLAGHLEAERGSREASRRVTLLKRRALPGPCLYSINAEQNSQRFLSGPRIGNRTDVARRPCPRRQGHGSHETILAGCRLWRDAPRRRG